MDNADIEFIKVNYHNSRVSPKASQRYYKIIKEIKERYVYLPYRNSDTFDKMLAFDCLIYIIQVKDEPVRDYAYTTIKTVCKYLPDIEKAWDEVISLFPNDDGYLEHLVFEIIRVIFPLITDKQKGWDNVYSLLKNELRPNCRRSDLLIDNIYEVIQSIYLLTPDKQKAWDALYETCQSMGGGCEWRNMIELLGEILQETPDKEKAWKDLCRLIPIVFGSHRYFHHAEIKRLPGIIVYTVQYVPNKQIVWEELYRLYNGEPYLKYQSIQLIDSILYYGLDNKKLLDDLKIFLDGKDDKFFRYILNKSNLPTDVYINYLLHT